MLRCECGAVADTCTFPGRMIIKHAPDCRKHPLNRQRDYSRMQYRHTTMHDCNAMIILINYYTRPSEQHHEGYVRNAPASREAIRTFYMAGLIERADSGSDRFQITEKGRVAIRMLEQTPFPKTIVTKESFVDPRTNQEVPNA